KMFPDVPQVQLAMFHTIFNVTTVIIILPLTNLLVKLVCRIIPNSTKKAAENEPHFYYLDENMLKTPPIAVQQAKREVINMGEIAINNFNRALDIIVTMNFAEKGKFAKDEEQLNYLNSAIIDYVVKLSRKSQLSEHDHRYLTTVFRSVRDIERIGDYAENIVEYADLLNETHEKFSPQAIEEIEKLRTMINDLYAQILQTYTNNDKTSLEKANAIEDEIDEFTKFMETSHIARMSLGICSPTVGAEYLSLSSNAERVADHLINVGKVIMDFKEE
ncbi:MAG: Na/Pi cotransporter family protein, partial [Bacteroidales bacterium]|nr:Na/Pi cotransporter family protein [Bacteroidales bacterium]